MSYSALVLGAIATIIALVHSGGGMASLLSGFTLWALVPYAAFAVATAISRTRGSIITVVSLSCAAVAFALFGYGALFVGHQSSTAGLVFVFLPLYQLVAAVIVLVFAAERRRHATNDI